MEEQPVLMNETITKHTNRIPVKYAPSFQRIYGSQSALASTSWDVSFTIAQPIADNPQDIHMEQRVLVTMSWQAAKAFAAQLSKAVKDYEEKYGVINPVPSAQASV